MKVLNHDLSIVFYDVTTLYFEAEEEYDLRRAGFSNPDNYREESTNIIGVVSKSGKISYSL